jgi:hypothetical protein
MQFVAAKVFDLKTKNRKNMIKPFAPLHEI